ncbi:MAG: YggS family pyridoxal phosphate-dependent enzyme [Flavobacteriales bacterium]|nr:YggS family pyridoxal phosphate-dependent enzyme [Flavobacteriales bacterium]
MTTIAENIRHVKSEIPNHVTLVAVSKTKPNELLTEAYHAGQRIFGENRVQELVPKSETLPKDIAWHMIGHLQRNKIKYIAPFVSCIQSVDTVDLLAEINKQAAKHSRSILVLLQFHIAQEDTKFGLTLEEAETYLASTEFAKLRNIEIAGVMGMATFTDDELQVRTEFKTLKSIFGTLKSQFFSTKPSFKEISMGMSGDYKIAIEEGSTMVRVGSSIFGSRS